MALTPRHQMAPGPTGDWPRAAGTADLPGVEERCRIDEDGVENGRNLHLRRRMVLSCRAGMLAQPRRNGFNPRPFAFQKALQVQAGP
jgi:hypothetical protein